MRFLTALLNLVLLICPCALCYGQVSFSSVNGERGYAAMRGSFRWEADNGIVLLPSGGYYRISDKEEDETGSVTKFALLVSYSPDDDWTWFAGGHYIPRRLGFENAGYIAGTQYALCYWCGPFKNAYLRAWGGQSFYDITAYADGTDYPGGFSTTGTLVAAELGSELGKFFLQARYEKVIKYNHRPPTHIAAHWTEIPFMTAVVQGFVRDTFAARAAYRTSWITPYVVYARYKYMENSDYTVSVAGGLAIHLEKSTFSGGVEIFEQNREENRKTYFSVAINTEF